jgi:hypothetical protein
MRQFPCIFFLIGKELVGGKVEEYHDLKRENKTLMPIFLKFPFTIIQWANLPGFQPARNAVKVESMLEYEKTSGYLNQNIRL